MQLNFNSPLSCPEIHAGVAALGAPPPAVVGGDFAQRGTRSIKRDNFNSPSSCPEIHTGAAANQAPREA
jgi:hypothetical protein